MLTIDGLEKWYVNTVKLKHAFAGTTPPDPIPLPSVTTIDGLLEGIVAESMDARIEAAIASGYENTTEEEAYTYTLPDKLWKWVGIKSVGGKTIASNGVALTAPVTSIVSKDADGNVLQTYTVPAEVQALPGYGWSAGNKCNYIDFVNKKFVQNVDRADDLGSFTWLSSYSHFYTSALNGIIRPTSSKSVAANIIIPLYTTLSYNKLYSYTIDQSCSVGRASGVQDNVQIYDTSQTLADLPAHLDGVPIYYELDTPVETDISAYLTDDVITDVAAGGTITFVNQNNIPVPVIVDYVGK